MRPNHWLFASRSRGHRGFAPLGRRPNCGARRVEPSGALASLVGLTWVLLWLAAPAHAEPPRKEGDSATAAPEAARSEAEGQQAPAASPKGTPQPAAESAGTVATEPPPKPEQGAAAPGAAQAPSPARAGEAAPPPPSAAAASAAASSPPGAASTGRGVASLTPDARAAAKGAASYTVRLRDLEARVDELKEQIRRSHTRLSLLSDAILAGGVGGARAHIRFRNDLSGAFRLTRALVLLDGVVQYNKEDESGALAEQKEIPIFRGSITPGDHTIQVRLQVKGHGYGVFSYLRGFNFKVNPPPRSFTVTEGKELDLEVVAGESGGVTTPLDERLGVRYFERLKDLTDRGSGDDIASDADEKP